MHRLFRLLLSSAALATIVSARDAQPAPPDDYPLTTCLVSDEPLGSMGEAERYVYREEGKPDRVVYFCCGGCQEDFDRDPAPFLAKLDAAEARREGDKKPAEKPADSEGHSHR